MFRIALLCLFCLISSCTSYVAKSDKFGIFLIKLSESHQDNAHYSVIFTVPGSENNKSIQQTLTMRALSICNRGDYLIKYFRVTQANSFEAPTIAGNGFYEYKKRNREATAVVVCNPTSEQIAAYEKWNAANPKLNNLASIINEADDEGTEYFGIELFNFDYSLEKKKDIKSKKNNEAKKPALNNNKVSDDEL